MSASDENFFNTGIGAIADMLAKTDENGGVFCKGNAAVNRIVEKYQEKTAMLLCPYISRRIGIAEWIVRCDMKQRYSVITNHST